MQELIRLVLLTTATMLGTTPLGWAAPALVGGLWGFIGPEPSRRVVTASLAAVLGWGGLLASQALSGEFGALVRLLEGILSAPGPLLLLGTLLVGGLLAALGAWLGLELRRLIPLNRSPGSHRM